MSEAFRELVYDADAWGCIKQRFPQATFEDASDFIHDSRIEVRIPDATDDDFYPFIIAEGWGPVCLGLQLMVHQRECHDQVRRWIAEAKSQPAGDTKEVEA